MNRKTDIYSQGGSLYVPYYQLISNYRNEIQTNNNTVSEETFSAMLDTKPI